MSGDNLSTIKFTAIQDDTKVDGENTGDVVNGKATFENTIFIAQPGMKDVKFKLTTSAANYKLLQHIDPVKYADQIISVNFRWCKPGEIQDGNTCIKCNTGSFSLTWNSTQCLTCPDNASCEQERISLSAGYWRISRNSTDIMECPNEEACLGGYNATSKYPVNWKEEYHGLLCNEWVIEGETKYERISENQCSKWPAFASNLMRIIGCGIAIFIFVIILIV